MTGRYELQTDEMLDTQSTQPDSKFKMPRLKPMPSEQQREGLQSPFATSMSTISDRLAIIKKSEQSPLKASSSVSNYNSTIESSRTDQAAKKLPPFQQHRFPSKIKKEDDASSMMSVHSDPSQPRKYYLRSPGESDQKVTMNRNSSVRVKGTFKQAHNFKKQDSSTSIAMSLGSKNSMDPFEQTVGSMTEMSLKPGSGITNRTHKFMRVTATSNDRDSIFGATN